MTASLHLIESELILKAKNGDRKAFSELVRSHAKGVLNVVYRMSGNRELAEDAAQEAFIQAWGKLDSFQVGTSFRNWLYRIAVNMAVDMLRKEKRLLPHQLEELGLEDRHSGPESITVKNEQSEVVRTAVIALPSACRAVLILREYEGLTYREISETLDIPVGTVMSRLNYARKLLRGKLQMMVETALEAENE